jgi:hypothetical protein
VGILKPLWTLVVGGKGEEEKVSRRKRSGTFYFLQVPCISFVAAHNPFGRQLFIDGAEVTPHPARDGW